MEVRHLLCINGHNERIWSVAWSKYEDIFATSSSDCKVKIWRFVKSEDSYPINPCSIGNPECGREYTFELEFEIDKFFKKTVRSVKFSSDGKYLICASFDGTSSLWSKYFPSNNESNVSKKPEWKCLAVLEGHENEVKCAFFDSTAKYIATCGRDKTIWIYEKATENSENDYEDLNKLELNGQLNYFCSGILRGHSHDVKYVCWNPVALLLASASYDNTIKLWTLNRNDWVCIQTLNFHTNTVWCLSFNSNGSKLASCSSDKNLFVYQSKTVKNFVEYVKTSNDQLKRFRSFKTTFPVPSFQGKPLLDHYGPLIADDWEVNKAYEELHSRPIYSLDFGDLLITAGGDNKVKILNLEEGFSDIAEIKAHSSDVNSVCWKSDHKERIFASVGDDEYIRFWKIV